MFKHIELLCAGKEVKCCGRYSDQIKTPAPLKYLYERCFLQGIDLPVSDGRGAYGTSHRSLRRAPQRYILSRQSLQKSWITPGTVSGFITRRFFEK